MPTTLIDDRGRAWDARSERLKSRLGASITGPALLDYAVRNLGFVAVGRRNSALRIGLRPATVHDIALAAGLRWLLDHRARRIVVSVFDDGWHHEIHGDIGHAIGRLGELVSTSRNFRPRDFLRCRRPLDALAPEHALSKLAARWRDCCRRPDFASLENALLEELNGLYLVVDPCRGATITEIGPGYRCYDEPWIGFAPGGRLENHSDFFYGRWAAQAYFEAYRENQPALHDVDAIVDLPGRPRSRLRYRRLILPLENATLLAGITFDRTIDLRAEAG